MQPLLSLTHSPAVAPIVSLPYTDLMDIKGTDPIEITLSQSQSMDSVIGINEEEVSPVRYLLPAGHSPHQTTSTSHCHEQNNPM